MCCIKKLILLVAILALVGCASEHDKLVTKGEGIYQANCKVCHSQGINGAPVLGNQPNWSARAPQGIDVLVEHASNGYGLMPAKGGKTHLTEDDIRAAITFMLSKLEK